MVKIYKQILTQPKQYVLLSAFLVTLVLIPVFLLLPKSPLPKAVRQQASFAVLVPHGDKIEIKRDSAKYDNKLKLLSYQVLAFGQTVVISQQSTPESFTDIPQVYEKVIANMHEYHKFEVEAGTVHLTKLANQQTAVLNSKGTLLFAKPQASLSNQQWRELFKALDVLH